MCAVDGVWRRRRRGERRVRADRRRHADTYAPFDQQLHQPVAVSQTFASEAANSNVAFQTGSGITQRSASAPATLSVSYDAANQSYTVQTQGRSQVFAPTDAAAGNPGEQRFVKANGEGRDYLTLVTTPYYNVTGQANRYVGLGYWQRNATSAGVQDTTLDVFTYGLTSPDAAVPRSGTASWTTDIFGLLTTPGARPRVTQGSGAFTADFQAGAFSTTANLDESDFLTGGGTVGSLRLIGGGALGSGNGFSGNFSYNGTIAVNGTIAGKFYGPNADEIGASFSATNATGGALSGAMTGQRAGSTANSLSLTNLVATERLVSFGAGTEIASKPGMTGYFQVSNYGGSGFVTVRPDGTVDVDMGRSDLPFAQLTPADRSTSSRPNYDVYDKVVAGTPVHIELYRPGPSNSELALTYVSFGTWRASKTELVQDGTLTRDRQLQFIFGFQTPRDLLAGRTGSARYDGIVAASGASMDGRSYLVGGTSRFDVDFNQSRYSGALTLSGREASGTTRDFGSFTFASTLGAGQMVQASFDGSGVPGFQTIQPQFYGPDGQEIGATFKLRVGSALDPSGVDISGVTVAKRR